MITDIFDFRGLSRNLPIKELLLMLGKSAALTIVITKLSNAILGQPINGVNQVMRIFGLEIVPQQFPSLAEIKKFFVTEEKTAKEKATEKLTALLTIITKANNEGDSLKIHSNLQDSLANQVRKIRKVLNE